MRSSGRIGSADPATRPPAQAPAGLGDTASVRCASNLTEIRNCIRELDRQIDANRLANPSDRYERECGLFWWRGEAQLIRNRLEAAAFKPKAMPRQKKCPACKGSGRLAA